MSFKKEYFFNTQLYLGKGNNLNFFELILLLQMLIINKL